jgi:hypothetical protein
MTWTHSRVALRGVYKSQNVVNKDVGRMYLGKYMVLLVACNWTVLRNSRVIKKIDASVARSHGGRTVEATNGVGSCGDTVCIQPILP